MFALDGLLNSVLSAGLGWLDRQRKPAADGRLVVPSTRVAGGLHSPVEVIRDRWGVPHIFAHNMGDMMFVQGFVHAQDRLWQMDLQRRLVAGRMAEIVGKPAVALDRWMRILSMRRVAELEVALISPAVRADLDAYVAGINAGMAQTPRPIECVLLGYTPEPWTVADTLSWIKMMSWNLSINWETEILRSQLIARLGPEGAAELEPTYFDRWPRVFADAAGLMQHEHDATDGVHHLWGGPASGDGGPGRADSGSSALEAAEAARPFVGPPADVGLGSNNWVLSGQWTASGKPLLANDMHLVMGIPAIWYENHLMDGECNVSGVTFPGIPGVVAGHNSRVAWGFTNGFPDVQDLYIEHLRRADDGRVQYEFRGEWPDARVYHEQIKVKGGEPVIEEVIVTRHGPIINGLAAEWETEQPLALRWTSLEPDTMIHAVRSINCAGTCLELRYALRDWTGPVQNVVYADVDGNIGYSFPGKVPIRAKGDGTVPVPGWTGEYEWMGYIPYDELPHLYNPPEGFIVTANNRVAPDDYPYFLSREQCQGDRAERITELILARQDQKIDVPYIQRMQFDQVSPTARTVAACVGQMSTGDPELDAVVKMMHDWDGVLGPASAPAAVHEVFVRKILYALLQDRLGDLTARYIGKGPVPVLAEGSLFGERALEWLQRALTAPALPSFGLTGEQRDALMRRALRETVDDLKARLGPSPANWAWGKLHHLTFRHLLSDGAPGLGKLLNRGPYPIGGDGTTVWASGSSYHEVSGDYTIAPPFRFIADLSDLSKSVGVLAPGQSGRPSSAHYDDQIEAWFQGGYHPMLLDRAEIEAAAESVLLLQPGA
jgi:penicillin amidase